MIDGFRKIPEPLQRQIMLRICFAFTMLLLLSFLLCAVDDAHTAFPILAASGFCAFSAFSLYRKAVRKEYVMLSGVCAECMYTALRKRAKFIVLDTGEYMVRVMRPRGLRRVATGSFLDLYLPNDALVYEKDGMQVVYTYWVLCVKGGAVHGTNGSTT